jgi:hypothetical protein
MIGAFAVPVMAQGGVTAGFTIQVKFYFLCVCTLTNMKVVVSDQTGKVVATAVSNSQYDGSPLLITFTEFTPEYWFLLNANGYASFSYNLPWLVGGASIITVDNLGGFYSAEILLRSTTSSSSVFFGS